MTDTQDRIIDLLRVYEELELRLEQTREAMTPLEAFYVEQIIQFRREQMVALAEAERSDGAHSLLSKTLASRFARMAVVYENKLTQGSDRLIKFLEEHQDGTHSDRQ